MQSRASCDHRWFFERHWKSAKLCGTSRTYVSASHSHSITLQSFSSSLSSFLCTLTSFPKLLPHSLLPHSCSSPHIFTLHSVVRVCVFCLSGCVCSNLSKHSLVWELRDPCVWCVVWEQHEQQIHHARSGAYTHTQHVHTPQGLIAETTCGSG